jgi:hypothetical protein
VVEALQVVQRRVHLLRERRIGRGALRPGHHERLRRDVLLELLLLEQRLCLDRFRVVREVEVRRERVAQQDARGPEAQD